MPESEMDIENAYKFGISKDEFEEIKKLLNRNPTDIEISIYSNFLSINGTVKSKSINIEDLTKKIKKIFDESGILYSDSYDINSEISCYLQIESVISTQPDETYYESAASTINLYRNLISHKVKAISGINSFHFSTQNIENAKTSLIDFINGSSNYSNTFGTPIAGIHAHFNECNLNRPMLNSFLIGVKNKLNVERVKLLEPGNKVLIINHEPDQKLNSIVYEKVMHESISEALGNDLIIDLQNITNSTFLTSCIKLISKTEYGLQIELDTIQKNLQPNDIEIFLNSKPNASFLIVCEQENDKNLTSLFNQTGIICTEIGQLIEKKHLTLLFQNKIIADLPIKSIQFKVNASQALFTEHAIIQKDTEFDINQIPPQKNLREIAWFMIKHPNVVSKKWIWEQYDSMVDVSNMSTNFTSCTPLINLKESNSALALSLEINSRYFKANPEIAIQIAVSEAARKIVCTGAKPIALTTNFNFINQPSPDNSAFSASIKGLVKVCKEFKTQLISPRINSFEIDFEDNSTNRSCFMPITGVVGILKDKNHQMTISFKNKGNIIFLIGQSMEDISSSEYLYSYHQVKNSPAPWFNLALEHKTQCAVHDLIEKNYVCSVHTVSKGGIFISLVESAMRFGLGFDIITDTDIRTDAFLFGESQGRMIVSITPNKEDYFIDFMLKKEVPFLALGHVTKGEMRIDDISFGFIEDAKREYENTFEKLINA